MRPLMNSTARRLLSRTTPSQLTRDISYASRPPPTSDTHAAAQSKPEHEASKQGTGPDAKKDQEASSQSRKKSMAELDEELRMKMEGMAGEGGSAGVEYENGKAEGLKRGVKANMFRVI